MLCKGGMQLLFMTAKYLGNTKSLKSCFPSQWLPSEEKKSALLRAYNYDHTSIPIDFGFLQYYIFGSEAKTEMVVKLKLKW